MKRPYSTGPIGKRSYATQLKAITKQGAASPPPREPPLSADGADLLTKLLALDPAERISAAAAMEHAWLRQALFASGSFSPGSRRSSKSRLDKASRAVACFAELSPLQVLDPHTPVHPLHPLSHPSHPLTHFLISCSPLQRLAFDAMAFTISPRKLEELRRTFHELDVDGSGTLSLAELRTLLGGGAAAEAAFAALDTMKTGEVSYTEFIAAMVAGQAR